MESLSQVSTWITPAQLTTSTFASACSGRVSSMGVDAQHGNAHTQHRKLATRYMGILIDEPPPASGRARVSARAWLAAAAGATDRSATGASPCAPAPPPSA